MSFSITKRWVISQITFETKMVLIFFTAKLKFLFAILPFSVLFYMIFLNTAKKLEVAESNHIMEKIPVSFSLSVRVSFLFFLVHFLSLTLYLPLSLFLSLSLSSLSLSFTLSLSLSPLTPLSLSLSFTLSLSLSLSLFHTHTLSLFSNSSLSLSLSISLTLTLTHFLSLSLSLSLFDAALQLLLCGVMPSSLILITMSYSREFFLIINDLTGTF